MIKKILLGLLFASTTCAAPGELYYPDPSQGGIVKFSSDGQTTSFFDQTIPQPASVAFDGQHNLYACFEGTVVKYGIDSTGSPSLAAKTTVTSGLQECVGIAANSLGQLFVSQTNENQIILVNTTPGQFYGDYMQVATVPAPMAMAVDSAGSLYVASQQGNVYKFSSGGQSLATYNSVGANLSGITVDSGNNIYVLENNLEIIKITPEGAVSNYLQLNALGNAVTAYSGDLFIATNNNQVLQYDSSGDYRIWGTAPPSQLGCPYCVVAIQIAFEPGALGATPPQELRNVSARGRLGGQEKTLIGGLIVQGSTPKKMVLRALSQSLGADLNPVEVTSMELHDKNGIIDFNRGWKTGVNASQIPVELQPKNDGESALYEELAPGSYTVVIRGETSAGTAQEGLGLFEAYDLDPASNSRFGNLSCRAWAGSNEEVVIEGFVVEGGSQKLVLRGIGPSLNVTTPLEDPQLTVYDAQGSMIQENDDWSESQQALIQASGLAPSGKESALIRSFTPGSYTALLKGVGGTVGIGVVEVYQAE